MAEIVRSHDRRKDTWDRFWKDKHGDVVVYQHPNVFLIGWLVVTIASLFTDGKTADILWYVALAILTVWSLLEIFRGINYFRRLLGVLVLALIALAAFKVGY